MFVGRKLHSPVRGRCPTITAARIAPFRSKTSRVMFR